MARFRFKTRYDSVEAQTVLGGQGEQVNAKPELLSTLVYGQALSE